MSFIIMQLSLTYYSLGVTISYCKFWFENDTLIQGRYTATCIYIKGIQGNKNICFNQLLKQQLGFSFTSIHDIHKTAEEGGGYLFNSSLPLPPASQTLRHQPGDYCREFTSAHSLQPDSNQEPLVSERKLLTTKLHALKDILVYFSFLHTSDLITQLLEMFHVHFCYISNMKNIKGNI